MSEKPQQAKFTQAETDLLWAVIKYVPKDQINSCVNRSVQAVARHLGIKKTATKKRWSRLAIRVRKEIEAADKGAVVAGIAVAGIAETEAETSGEDQEVVIKNDGEKHVRGKDVGGKDAKALGDKVIKNKVSQDKVIKKKATIAKGKRGKKGIKDEVTAKANIKKEESDEDFDDAEAAF
ncbi:uncharacterized protein EAF01_004691 [Botrytis porri]|uniref:uncharacterized protein n=1 Tax=Botrytis porri TaxID=87229 RepID=UPI0018FF3F57|nr:uncharacterized protein EAF01_004691 [Botrytis porri]KAF7907104.1 hypothetical protein EAF01_004691 [Botrytis porri]